MNDCRLALLIGYAAGHRLTNYRRPATAGPRSYYPMSPLFRPATDQADIQQEPSETIAFRMALFVGVGRIACPGGWAWVSNAARIRTSKDSRPALRAR